MLRFAWRYLSNGSGSDRTIPVNQLQASILPETSAMVHRNNITVSIESIKEIDADFNPTNLFAEKM